MKTARRKYHFPSRAAAEDKISLLERELSLHHEYVTLATNYGPEASLRRGRYIVRIFGTHRHSGGILAIEFHCPGQLVMSEIRRPQDWCDAVKTAYTRGGVTCQESRDYRDLAYDVWTKYLELVKAHNV